MGKLSLLTRLEALEAKRDQRSGFQIVGRCERNKDGSLAVYSCANRSGIDGGGPEHVIETVPKHMVHKYLKDLIRIERSYGRGKE